MLMMMPHYLKTIWLSVIFNEITAKQKDHGTCMKIYCQLNIQLIFLNKYFVRTLLENILSYWKENGKNVMAAMWSECNGIASVKLWMGRTLLFICVTDWRKYTGGQTFLLHDLKAMAQPFWGCEFARTYYLSLIINIMMNSSDKSQYQYSKSLFMQYIWVI
jgi:hypothetical protein